MSTPDLAQSISAKRWVFANFFLAEAVLVLSEFQNELCLGFWIDKVEIWIYSETPNEKKEKEISCLRSSFDSWMFLWSLNLVLLMGKKESCGVFERKHFLQTSHWIWIQQNVSRFVWIWIRNTGSGMYYKFNPDPVQDSDSWERLEKKFFWFINYPTFYLSLGLHKGCPSYRRSLRLSKKENIQHFKTWYFLLLWVISALLFFGSRFSGPKWMRFRADPDPQDG